MIQKEYGNDHIMKNYISQIYFFLKKKPNLQEKNNNPQNKIDDLVEQ